ncbi:hypothetical protein CROQUDRAFT_105052 [Cronartium quercuum f. sp. fusiforme G11]|uniref:Uncharacterized protein n=1 Tax=Cronartium quercuum f. sp. fusiforme G11 TaxID=708437 RepID=A0A9P6NLY6_9BASI|nr:hypothetical protein CROQUDRAFT_105052 [Cronartium quercuum f. sp. fusiforme G11]
MSVRPGPDQARACVAESGSGSRLVDRRQDAFGHLDFFSEWFTDVRIPRGLKFIWQSKNLKVGRW